MEALQEKNFFEFYLTFIIEQILKPLSNEVPYKYLSIFVKKNVTDI